MQNQLNFTFTNTISVPNFIYHKYTLISIFSSIPETQNVRNSHIHSDTKDNNTSCTDETEPFNQKQKILHPSSHCMKSQSFPVVKKMMHSLPKGHFLQSNLCSLSELKYHLNIHRVLKKLYKMRTTTILTSPYGKVNIPI